MRQGLFRQRVIDAQQQKLPGHVLLTPHFSYSLITLILVCLLTAVAFFLFTQQYSRYATVSGWLEPSSGQIRIHTQRYGTVSQLMVRRGDKIKAGDALFRITNNDTLPSGTSAHKSQIDALARQAERLQIQLSHTRQVHHTQRKQQANRVRALTEELTALNDVAETTQQRLRLARKQYTRAQQLIADGHLSRSEASQFHNTVLAVEQELGQLHRESVRISRELNDARQQQALLPDEQARERIRIQNQQSELSQRLAKTKIQHQKVIVSGISGTVSHIDIHVGQQVSPGLIALSLSPTPAHMVGQLIVPVRASGFLERGQPVSLRYDAFPYQKFGMANGIVTGISESLVFPGDMPSAPVAVKEPGYLVSVELSSSQIEAYGEHINLKSGMTFSADINLSERSLLEWLLDPIYSITGRY